MRRQISVPIDDDRQLIGDLRMPDDPTGVVLFAHGSGSGRHSPRNRYVAEVLDAAGLATLLIDLLTADEEHDERLTGHLRFDVELLSERLLAATAWLAANADTARLPLGYFGASTGAAAALIAAARLPGEIAAVVSRGGRPDLAGPALAAVHAPTLLLVGGDDRQVLELNHQALEALPGVKRLEVVPRAGHLFEEPGALDRVAALASRWFVAYLGRPAARTWHGAHP
jgi:putative phosphoribosyl transferase